MKRAGLKEAAEHTGLSAWELRTGALSGCYPFMRVGGPRGRFLFDLDLLDEAIERRMLEAVVTESEDGLDLLSVKFTIDDNPFLDPEYVENIKREYVGMYDWVRAEGLVYPHFDSSVYVVPTEPRNYTEYHVSNDYGVNHPLCVPVVRAAQWRLVLRERTLPPWGKGRAEDSRGLLYGLGAVYWRAADNEDLP